MQKKYLLQKKKAANPFELKAKAPQSEKIPAKRDVFQTQKKHFSALSLKNMWSALLPMLWNMYLTAADRKKQTESYRI